MKITALLLAVLIFGCAYPSVVPDTLVPEVDRKVSFSQIKSDPEAHKGKLVVLGGMVLEAKNLKDGTLIEVLQLPLDRWDEPAGPRTASGGRLLALHPDFLDTAVIGKGRRLTIVAEVMGSRTGQIGEVEYRYPHLAVKHLHLWTEYRARHFYPAPYYPYPPPVWWNRWPYREPYWPPPPIIVEPD
jgi:outer membrane lipoprotein